MVQVRSMRRLMVGLVVLLVAGAVAIGPLQQSSVNAQEAGSGAGQLTLAPEYETEAVDSPRPAEQGRLGWLGITNAGDLDGDGADDLVVPQYDGPGQMHVFSGADSELLYTIDHPDAATSGEGSEGNFVYPARVPDFGSCEGGEPGELCPNSEVGPPDDAPEILVGASGTDLDTPDLGRAYIFDGATGAVLKRLQLPPDDLASESEQFPEGKGFGFGRAVVSPADPISADAPESVRIGDITGGGSPDIVVSNPTFYEEGPDTNAACDPGPCEGAGRVYFYSGEDIAGSNPEEVLDAPFRVLKNPQPSSTEDHDRFGHALIPVGDLGVCNEDPGQGEACDDVSSDPDGVPEMVLSAHRIDVGGVSAGAVFLIDGATGSILRRYDHPEPQPDGSFGYSSGTMPKPIGDVAGTAHSDIYLPTVRHNAEQEGQGRGYVFTGNIPSDSILSTANDPTPSQSGNFGAPFTGIGNVAGDPRNEILIGAHGPLWGPGGTDDPTEGDMHVYSPISGEVVQSFSDPEDQPGNGFGQGVASLGDVNDDGHVDFAATAGFQDAAGELGAGRLYFFRSVAAEACPADEVETAPFTDRDDIPSAHVDNVDCAFFHDIVAGFEDDTFRAGFSLRRNQMASFIVRTLTAHGVELPEPSDDRFSDVSADSPHDEAIHRLAAAGVVQGGPGGLDADEYGPDLDIRRDQMASFLVRAAEFAIDRELQAGESGRFNDVPEGNVHADSINTAAEFGLVRGFEDDTYGPAGSVRRDQMASFSIRLLQSLTEGAFAG